MMATIDIAVQAEAMLVLPPAVVAEFVERSRPDSILIKGFHALPTLAQGRVVKYTRLDGREFFDDDAAVEACDLSHEGDAGGPMKSSSIEWGALWALNKKFIDASSPRYTAIISKDAVMLDSTILLEQADAAELVVGQEITLMNWGNALVRAVSRTDESGPITEITLALRLQGDVKKTKKIT
ncbi:hypothetical protein RJ55_02682 [Drechmeria coniospora]|nr:hypothetical protein RJ55_02682 [Drechmeria coniospora]